ncbi:transposase InsO family protein [Tsukamurella ocularis]|nr:transposase InsO family protein [Tsukamurella ocularis]
MIDLLIAIVWVFAPDGRRVMAPEGLYGRAKMTALIRARQLPGVTAGAVERGMRYLGLQGIRRPKGVRTTLGDPAAVRAPDLLRRDFTAPAPNRTWVTDFTYVPTRRGWVYVVFIVDTFSRRIVAWHAATSKTVDLVIRAHCGWRYGNTDAKDTPSSPAS